MKVENYQNAMVAPNRTAAASGQLEQAFLEQMLKYCGPQPGDGPFSGGAGEQQFSSFLTQEYASVLADSLDLGLEKYIKGVSK